MLQTEHTAPARGGRNTIAIICPALRFRILRIEEHQTTNQTCPFHGFAEEVPLKSAVTHFTTRRVDFRRRIFDQSWRFDIKERKSRCPTPEIILHAKFILLRLERSKCRPIVCGIISRNDSIACIKPLHIVRVDRHIRFWLVDKSKCRGKDRFIIARLDFPRGCIVVINLDVLLTPTDDKLPTLICCGDDIRHREARQRIFVILRL